MKAAILYICTGKYDIFWKSFYLSCEKFFLPDVTKEYFVFTDAKTIYDEENNANIHKIFQQRLGWPFDTLKRFHLFSTIENELAAADYVFFFNANAEILRPIREGEFLPTADEKLVAVLHPGYYNVKAAKFTYETRKLKSTAYIPKGHGQYYFAGGINGGRSVDYLNLIKELKRNIDRDLEKNIIAVWHDESHLNHYLIDKKPKILSPAYIYPEGWDLPFEPIILIRDKTKHGGHDFLRDTKTEQSIKKRLIRLFKNLLRG